MHIDRRLGLVVVLTMAGCLFTEQVRKTGVATGPSGADVPSGEMPPAFACTGAVFDPLAPALFFSDLQSGPNTGGEGDNGAFITLYGVRLGDGSQARVTFANAPVASALFQPNTGARGLDRVVVQLGAGAAKGAGTFVVTVNDRNSNALAFTVRAGGVYFASPTGNDSAPGSAAQPFASIGRCKAVMTSGDVCYLRAGIATPLAGGEAMFTIEEGGNPSQPIAYVGYPGDPAVFSGSPGGTDARAFWVQGNHVVLANLRISAFDSGVQLDGDGDSAVGLLLDHILSPNRSGDSVTVAAVQQRVLGTRIMQSGSDSSYNFAIRLQAASHAEIGWNEVRDHTGSFMIVEGGEGELSIHDNVFDTATAGSVQIGARGPLNFSNNIVANSPYSAIGFATINAYTVSHNLFYRGSVHMIDLETTSCSGPGITFVDNIINGGQTPATNVLTASNCITRAEKNLWQVEDDKAPAWDTAPLIGNASFTNVVAGDFSPKPASLVVDGGSTDVPCADFMGIVRNRGAHGAGPDVGPFELAQ